MSTTADNRSLVQGMLLATVALSIIPLMDVAGKLLTASLPVWQIAWARFFFHTLFLLPIFVARHDVRDLVRGRPLLQVVRASMMVPATASFYVALTTMPLPDALAVFFVFPCIMTILSAIFLGDRVRIWRWSATALGFIGALVVIQPGASAFSDAALFALATSFMIAIYFLMTRALAATAPPTVTMMITGLVGLAITSGLALPEWKAPDAREWALMAAMGAISLVTHFMMVMAYERAPPSVLAPFTYVEIVSATILSILIFRDVPVATTWIGIAIIVTSGLIIAWRERVRKGGA